MLNTRQSRLALACAALLLAAGSVRAADPKAFTLQMPEEFLSAVIKGALADAQSAAQNQGKRFGVQDVTVVLEGGRTVFVTLRTNLDTIRDVAAKNATSLIGKLENYLVRGGPDDYLLIKFRAKLSALAADTDDGGTPNDAVLGADFDNKDMQLELHKGGTTTACIGLEELALYLMDRYLTSVRISDSVALSAKIHFFWRKYFISSTGHRIVVRFYFARFPVVPFTLDASGISTDEHVLRVSGHRQ